MSNRWRWAWQRKLGYFFLCLLLGGLLVSGMPHLRAIAQSPSPTLLNSQGQAEFERGNFQAALERWQQAETQYRQGRNATGVWGVRLNQAKAWQNLGLYRRAQDVLASTLADFQAQPASELKARIWLEYGNVLRLTGTSSEPEKYLQEGLTIARQLQYAAGIQAAQLYLGTLLLAQKNYPAALQSLQPAATQPGALQLSAQLQYFKTLQLLDRTPEAIALLPQLEATLAALPPSSRAIYARIELATLLQTCCQQVSAPPSSLPAAQLLATAIQQSQAIGNVRAESYAIGQLGNLHQQTGQLSTANRLTQRAIRLAQQVNVPEILYRWQWQLGQILKAQGETTAAIKTYTEAEQVLRSLRQDLTGLDPNIQFSFRDEVEPVYRELVDLLLQPNASQTHLRQARQVVESLQLAELNNFFREACLDTEARPIDDIDPTAAVIYPVILSDRLEVILSTPGQPLRHYSTAMRREEVEAGIQRMRTALRRTAFSQERLAIMGQLYDWLIRPLATDLTQASTQTLIFVLDGPLRSLPMAALHDGDRYLIEQYQIAITPSLQLMNPRKFSSHNLRALVAGLSEGTAESMPLPGVQQEVKLIQQKIPAHVLLDRNFTTQAINAETTTFPFSLVHFATHGQFGSEAEKTFIKTWDGRLTINDLQRLLKQLSIENKSVVELLVLSACQTAEGDNRAALGMAGLAVRSGARSTLATLWAVNDASTAQFIAEFYQHLLQPQVSKAQAVRSAQLALIRSKEFNNPFYWAPFVLVGNWM
jgi:CHAT domain-containing protein